MPSLYDEWLNRPARLMYLSFDEYCAEKEGKLEAPVAPVVAEIAKVSRGRAQHTSGVMNGLEKKYAQHLEMRKMVGEITDYKFEPLKLKLAPATFYNPDFAVLMPDGRVELQEVKGSHWEDDARVKIKVAASFFAGWFRLVAVQWDKNSKAWKFEEFR